MSFLILVHFYFFLSIFPVIYSLHCASHVKIMTVFIYMVVVEMLNHIHQHKNHDQSNTVTNLLQPQSLNLLCTYTRKLETSHK